MLAWRFLLRLDRGVRFGNLYVVPKPVEFTFHGLTYNRKMSGSKNLQSSVDWKKQRKTVSTAWRPFCTQASSHEDCLVNDVIVKTDDGSQVQEVQCSIATDFTDAQHVIKGAEVVSTTTVGTLQDNVADRALDEESRHSAGKHSISLEVGASLIRFIKGKGGLTQKTIEEEMGVKVIIPSSKKEDYVTIEGFSDDSVTRASEKIQTIIDEAVKSPNLDYSHFISLPLAIHPGLLDKLINFQNSILGITCQEENIDSDSNEDTSDNEDKDKQLDKGINVSVERKVEDEAEHLKVDVTKIPLVSYSPKASKSSALSHLGIDKSIFIKPKTFHLTVLMLKLWNKDRVTAATEVLQSITSKVMDALDNRPLFVRLKGLDCMRGSLAKASVLYAPVEEIGNEDRLLRACQVIIDAYVDAGLVLEKDAKQKLKLHATVMNARHRKRYKRTTKADSFDARGIFKKYGSEEWGDYLIREAHLSQRFAFDENGYYHCCASLPFPENMQVD